MSASYDSTPVSIVHKSERDDVSVCFLASSIVSSTVTFVDDNTGNHSREFIDLDNHMQNTVTTADSCKQRSEPKDRGYATKKTRKRS